MNWGVWEKPSTCWHLHSKETWLERRLTSDVAWARTPLMAIMATVKGNNQDGILPANESAWKTLCLRVDVFLALVDAMLHLSRRNGKTKFNPESVNVVLVVWQVSLRYKSTL